MTVPVVVAVLVVVEVVVAVVVAGALLFGAGSGLAICKCERISARKLRQVAGDTRPRIQHIKGLPAEFVPARAWAVPRKKVSAMMIKLLTNLCADNDDDAGRS